jgi:ferrous iron transport protein B
MREGGLGRTRAPLRVALAGNPNSGKTTLFNCITGAHHKVGNYPGVTVEKREGRASFEGRDYSLVDLPGTYSLTAYSIDEVIARDFVLDERPDVVVSVMDSTNLERNLYLCLQFQELGLPLVGALNMSDEAAEKGIDIDDAKLSALLGLPLVKTAGAKGQGLAQLLRVIAEVASSKPAVTRTVDYGGEIEDRLGRLETLLQSDPGFASKHPCRWLAVKLVEKDAEAAGRLAGHSREAEIRAAAAEAVAWIEGHFAKDAEVVIAEQRYGYIRGACLESVKRSGKRGRSPTEFVDAIAMHPLLGLPIFLALIWGLFGLTFAIGKYPTAWLDTLFSGLAAFAGPLIPGPLLRSLVVNGILGGVGSVLSFVPLIVLLFFFLSILEDTGYMSRAAFITDRFLHGFGLHGQSFLPLMLGFGCSVPAILSTRTLKSRRDRIITALAIPFISCGAKLPVHILLAGAFFPKNPAAAVMAIYGVGVILALLSSLLLRRTVLKGDPTPFVMELPPYRLPTLRGIGWHVWEKSSQYARKAGTVILAASVLIWAITTFPQAPADPAGRATETAAFRLARPGASEGAIAAHLSAFEAQRNLSASMAGRLGRLVEPLIRPLGFDWKIGVAVITGFAAKEVVVSTFGILYKVGTDEGEGSRGLRAALEADPVFSPLVAFVLMLFVLVIPPCFAALATLRAELGTNWLVFSIVYMLSLGWLLAFATRSLGTALGWGV